MATHFDTPESGALDPRSIEVQYLTSLFFLCYAAVFERRSGFVGARIVEADGCIYV